MNRNARFPRLRAEHLSELERANDVKFIYQCIALSFPDKHPERFGRFLCMAWTYLLRRLMYRHARMVVGPFGWFLPHELIFGNTRREVYKVLKTCRPFMN